jgi:hypothetical protein
MTMNIAHHFVADKDQNGSLGPGKFAKGSPVLAVIARALH